MDGAPKKLYMDHIYIIKDKNDTKLNKKLCILVL